MQSVRKQEPGLLPVAPHGSLRDTESQRDLLFRHAVEEAHFDDPRKPCIHTFEFFKGAADSRNSFAPRMLDRGDPCIEFDVYSASAMRLGVAAADRVDYDVVHNARGIANKRGPIGHATIAGFGESNIGLVNQRVGIEQSVATEAKPGPCNSAELGISGRCRARLVMRFHTISLDLTVGDCA
jgi:hypothetical protein